MQRKGAVLLSSDLLLLVGVRRLRLHDGPERRVHGD